MITKFKVRCKACEEVWEYTLEPEQALYGAAYVIGARHETLPCTYGKDCYLHGARYIELIGLEVLN